MLSTEEAPSLTVVGPTRGDVEQCILRCHLRGFPSPIIDRVVNNAEGINLKIPEPLLIRDGDCVLEGLCSISLYETIEKVTDV